MNNLEKYQNAFIEALEVSADQLPTLKYQDIHYISLLLYCQSKDDLRLFTVVIILTYRVRFLRTHSLPFGIGFSFYLA